MHSPCPLACARAAPLAVFLNPPCRRRIAPHGALFWDGCQGPAGGKGQTREGKRRVEQRACIGVCACVLSLRMDRVRRASGPSACLQRSVGRRNIGRSKQATTTEHTGREIGAEGRA